MLSTPTTVTEQDSASASISETDLGGPHLARSVGLAQQQTGAAIRGYLLERRRLTVLWLMVFSTLAWLPGGFTRFVFPKLLVVSIACLLGATLPRSTRLPRAVALALVIGAGITALAACAGQTPVASLIGRWPRYEGLPVLGLYAASAWLGARVVGRGLLRAVHLAHALAAMSLVLFAFSLHDALRRSPGGPASIARSGSLLGNATDQGLVAMMAGVVIAAVVVIRRDPLLMTGGVAAFATVAFSASRAALMLSVVGIVVVLVLSHRGGHLSGRHPWAAGAAGPVTMAAIAFMVPATHDRLLETVTGSGRVLQWRLTLAMVADHPWLGLGPSRYLDAFGRYESPAFVRFTGPRTMADSPHDLILQTAVAGGIPLVVCLAALTWFLVGSGRIAVREHPEAMGPAVAAAAYAVAMLANFTAAGSTCLAAFLAGSVIAQPLSTMRCSRSRSGRLGVAMTIVTFVVCVGVTAMSCVAEVEVQRGITAAERGDEAAARRDIDAARIWRPLDGDISMFGAETTGVLIGTTQPAASADTFSLARDSLHRTPSSYASRVALAVALIHSRDLGAAERVLDQAVASFPDRPDAYVQRAIARARSRDVPGARADLQAAARIEPRSRVPGRLMRRIGSPGAPTG